MTDRPGARVVASVETARELLEGRGTSFSAALAAALARVTSATLEGAERHWVDRLEDYTRRLLARTDLIKPSHDGGGDSRTVGEVAKASKKPYDCLMLFMLARAAKPRLCLELGTNVGVSAAYQASAQKLNGGGRTVTLEGSPGRSQVATQTFSDLGLDNVELRVGRFQRTLEPTLEELGSVDWAFIDGHHQELPTLEYFERISTRLARPGLILVDDIRWSDGMVSAWNQIKQRRDVSLAVDLERIGLCLFE